MDNYNNLSVQTAPPRRCWLRWTIVAITVSSLIFIGVLVILNLNRITKAEAIAALEEMSEPLSDLERRMSALYTMKPMATSARDAIQRANEALVSSKTAYERLRGKSGILLDFGEANASFVATNSLIESRLSQYSYTLEILNLFSDAFLAPAAEVEESSNRNTTMRPFSPNGTAELLLSNDDAEIRNIAERFVYLLDSQIDLFRSNGNCYNTSSPACSDLRNQAEDISREMSSLVVPRLIVKINGDMPASDREILLSIRATITVLSGPAAEDEADE